ncbi:MAG: MarR family transcriptional regulator [Parcubacteria group bacterium]|jgi:sugar-specific transcriptional regulator TrmB
MKNDTSKKILAFIEKNNQVTPKELVDYLGITKQAVFRQLSKLIENKVIFKNGKPPRVFYFINIKKDKTLIIDGMSCKTSADNIPLERNTTQEIENNYLIITPSGEKKEGLIGFTYWCEKNNLPLEKTATEYIQTLKKYAKFKKNNLIDGTQKIKNTFSKSYLDHLFYLDFYSLERFGKTKLGQLLLYAKQSQDKKLIQELSTTIAPQINSIVLTNEIDGVGFIPPTVKREVQFMKELERILQLNLKRVSISKIKTDISVPQKTLNKLDDRIENADKTIIVRKGQTFKNILLIDDAVGSGATLNQTAKKIRTMDICSGKIIGLAITGSFKGFDVISEV